MENILDRFCVDLSKVRAHGFSNGGMMVFELLQSRIAHHFEALVSVAGLPQNGTQHSPASKARFLGIWSAQDYVIPPLARRERDNTQWSDVTLSDQGLYFTSANQAINRIASSYGCRSAVVPTVSTLAGFKCIAFPACPAGEAVSCFHEGGHVWPPEANSLIYSFYDQGMVWPETADKKDISNVVYDSNAAENARTADFALPAAADEKHIGDKHGANADEKNTSAGSNVLDAKNLAGATAAPPRKANVVRHAALVTTGTALTRRSLRSASRFFSARV